MLAVFVGGMKILFVIVFCVFDIFSVFVYIINLINSRQFYFNSINNRILFADENNGLMTL